MMFAQANSEHCRHKIFNASLDHRRRRPAAVAVQDDQAHPRADAGATRCRRTATTPRWWKAIRRGASAPIRRRSAYRAEELRDSAFCIKVETHNHPTAISPFAGRVHRRRRRDPRRGRDRARRQAQGRPVRFPRLAPAHPDVAAAVGTRARAESAHGAGAGDHARRPARRGRVQQRIRPPEPDRLFPSVRTRKRHAVDGER